MIAGLYRWSMRLAGFNISELKQQAIETLEQGKVLWSEMRGLRTSID